MEALYAPIVEACESLRTMKARQLAHQTLNLAMVVLSAIMIWKGLMVLTYSHSPVVVVLSGSMEPAYYRGDIIFLHKWTAPYRAGDVCVFKLGGRDIPIVHRIVKVHEKPSGAVDLLTKGDNNAVDDRGLYSTRKSWVHAENVVGRAKGYLPYLGMVTIIMNDYPIIKYVLVGTMGLFVLSARE